MLDKNKEFVSLSKAGMNILNLSTTPKRLIKDNEGFYKQIHSLANTSYLKIDKVNYLKFLC